MKKEIFNIVIAGAGLMGSSIAQSFPQYGYPTVVYSNCKEDFLRAKQIIANGQKTLVENGVLTAEESAGIQNEIRYTTDMSCFAEADWIIEAIPENAAIKKELFEHISEIAGEDTIVTSNTSAISINALSKCMKRPKRFCGTHWLNPPHIIPLVEITKSNVTSQETVDSIYDILCRMKKQPVVLKKDVKGFLSNRLQFALLREATHLVESGVATPEDIDRTLKYGNGLRYMCSGPFKIVDFGGVSVFNSVAKYLYPDLDCEEKENHLLGDMVERGYNGISTMHGFYDYTETSAIEEEKERDSKMLEVLKLQ